MGVVRIDDELEQQIAAHIKEQENKYKYPSKSTFLNIIINDFFVEQKAQQEKTSDQTTRKRFLVIKRGKK